MGPEGWVWAMCPMERSTSQLLGDTFSDLYLLGDTFSVFYTLPGEEKPVDDWMKNGKIRTMLQPMLSRHGWVTLIWIEHPTVPGLSGNLREPLE